MDALQNTRIFHLHVSHDFYLGAVDLKIKICLILFYKSLRSKVFSLGMQLVFPLVCFFFLDKGLMRGYSNKT